MNLIAADYEDGNQAICFLVRGLEVKDAPMSFTAFNIILGVGRNRDRISDGSVSLVSLREALPADALSSRLRRASYPDPACLEGGYTGNSRASVSPRRRDMRRDDLVTFGGKIMVTEKSSRIDLWISAHPGTLGTVA